MLDRQFTFRTMPCWRLLLGAAALLDVVLLGSTQRIRFLAAQEIRTEPLTAGQSTEKIVVHDGYRVELVASEPAVVDPVDMAFDDSGNLWVVEMRDYPFSQSEVLQGRIRVLRDMDGDGHYDQSQVFADNLDMPTGIALWRDGAVVTVAGRLIFLRDSNSDFVADVTEEWLVGFTRDNEQLRANHPRLGLDGKWYVANGLRGGTIRLGSHYAASERATSTNETHSRNESDSEWNLGSRDLRFDSSTGRVELISGPAQFGLSVDRFGRRYFCSNRNPAMKAIFEQEDLNGNPLASLTAPTVDVVPAGEQSQVFPAVSAWTTSNLHAGQYTAACGVFAWLPDSTPLSSTSVGASEVYVCEPTGSLVTQNHLQPDIGSEQYVAPAQNEAYSWLVSRDPWFRPVNIGLAPDGGLVLVDMHRAVIEHPRWVPEELKDRPDQRYGDAAGRIYWIGSSLQAPLAESITRLHDQPLSTLSDLQLVEQIVSNNPWLRETARRLLLQRYGGSARSTNRELIASLLRHADASDVSANARVCCLQLACVLDATASQWLPRYLTVEGSEAITVAAIRALRWIDFSSTPDDRSAAATALSMLVDASKPPVQFESLLALGLLSDSNHQPTLSSHQVAKVLANFRTTAYRARWLVALGSAMRHSPQMLQDIWLTELELFDAWQANSSSDMQVVEGTTRRLFQLDQHRAITLGAAIGRLEQLTATESSLARPAALVALLTLLNQGRAGEFGNHEQRLWPIVRELVLTETQTTPVRQRAALLLARSGAPSDVDLLSQLSRQMVGADVWLPFVKAWASTSDPNCDQFLVEQLANSAPRTQRGFLELIAARPQRIQLLSLEIAKQRLSARQIGLDGMNKVIAAAEGAVKEQLRAEVDAIVNRDRQQVLEQYLSCLELKGQPQNGRAVFEKQCSACHRIAGVGQDVGPDISDSRTASPLQLLTSILIPNQKIDNNYFRYGVLKVDGTLVEGMIIEETSESITLRSQQQPRITIAREEIDEILASGMSLMPDGLEAQIEPQSMADLLAFIKQWRYLDGSVPLSTD
ncbi:MAG: c-type cytochrome [Planctomycetales bacterium]|nr:c-type cytochrome [Planctomycetales bacterium]